METLTLKNFKKNFEWSDINWNPKLSTVALGLQLTTCVKAYRWGTNHTMDEVSLPLSLPQC